MVDAGARMILHSRAIIDDEPHDLMTLEIIMHRFVLAEFNTHGQIAKNSASSRAIPVRKTLESVAAYPAYPVEWRKEQKGMQGGEHLDSEAASQATYIWQDLIEFTVERVKELQNLGVHKSISNRPLEPYLWHTVVATATREAWDHFLDLRDSSLAQPEIRAVAKIVRYTIENSNPTQFVGLGDWHLPFVQQVDYIDIVEELGLQEAKRISAARCARVSYLTHDGGIDWEADLRLAKRLFDPGEGPPHLSPFEHVATPAGHLICERLKPFSSFRQEVERGEF